MKAFYSVRDLVEATGYSAGTIQGKIRSGEIFAVQATKQGAFRIPASSYAAYLASLGLGSAPTTEMHPPTAFEATSPGELYQRDISPALARARVPDMPALLQLVEADPSLYEEYQGAIRAYNLFLGLQARSAVGAVYGETRALLRTGDIEGLTAALRRDAGPFVAEVAEGLPRTGRNSGSARPRGTPGEARTG